MARHVGRCGKDRLYSCRIFGAAVSRGTTRDGRFAFVLARRPPVLSANIRTVVEPAVISTSSVGSPSQVLMRSLGKRQRKPRFHKAGLRTELASRLCDEWFRSEGSVRCLEGKGRDEVQVRKVIFNSRHTCSRP